MRRQTKPDKFPLRLHATGQWTKKIRGRSHYFGTNKDAALAQYVRDREDLEAGRVPRPRDENAVTVRELANEFLHARRGDVESGELSTRQWDEYRSTCETLVAEFGGSRAVVDLRPEDFGRLKAKAARRLGVFALAKFIQMTRTAFKFGFDNGHLPLPVKYGTLFDKPPARLARLRRADATDRVLTAGDCRKLIDAAPPQLRAMIYLALNCGHGPTDLSALDRSDLARRPGWLVYARQKTGIGRKCPLWPETVDALAEVESGRPDPKDPADADAVFLTRSGRRWVRYRAGRTDALGQEFGKLAKRAGVEASGFYSLRRTFRSAADGARDRDAVNAVMGHADPGMRAVYVQDIEVDRLVVIVEHVRAWLMAGDRVAAAN
jgi:integrase